MSICHYCRRDDISRSILPWRNTAETVSKSQTLMWVCPDCETGQGMTLERRTRLWPIPVAGMVFLVMIAWAVAFAVH